MCAHIKRDPVFADHFFFEEHNNPENNDDGTFKPQYDFQGLIDRQIENNDVIWIQAARGSAKSYSAARAIVKICLRYPNERAIIVAPAFRQSKYAFNYAYEMLKVESGVGSHTYKLEQECDIENDVKRGHEFLMQFSTGSTIEALPMGQEGAKNRGKRATIVLADEFYLFSRETMVSHVEPFMNVQIGERPPKLIYLTTSYFQDTYAYEVLMGIAARVKRGEPGYCIIDLTIDDIIRSKRVIMDDEADDTRRRYPISDKHVLKQLEDQRDPITGQLSEDAQMTFYNVWVKSSDNFFKTGLIADLANSDAKVLEARPKSSEIPFVMGVDPAGMGDDSFAISILSCPGNDVRLIHAVYQWEKIIPEQAAAYIQLLTDLYGVQYIVMDKTGQLGAIIVDELTKPPARLVNGEDEPGQPIYLHDHAKAYLSRVKFCMTRPGDPLMAVGLYTDQYQRPIGGENSLKNAMLLSMRATMETHKILYPKGVKTEKYSDATGDLGHSGGDLMDNIREAMAQFPRIKPARNREGQLKQDESGNFQFTRPPKDDAAFSIVYGNWAANIFYKSSPKTHQSEVAIVWVGESEIQDDQTYSHQVVRPRLF